MINLWLNNFHCKIVFKVWQACKSIRFQGERLRQRCSDGLFNHDVRLPRISLSLFLCLSTIALFIHSWRIIAGTNRVLMLVQLSLEIAATPTPLSRVHGSSTINNARGSHYLSLTLRIPVFTTKGERMCGNRRPTRLAFTTKHCFPQSLIFHTTITTVELLDTKFSQKI